MAASSTGQPQFIASTGGNRSSSNAPLIENTENDQIVVPDKKSWKNLFDYMGPGFLVSIAYIDPGNFRSTVQVWVTLDHISGFMCCTNYPVPSS
ncbi:hypothetical protein LWI29_003650 [Acer saccharum]|uniref:Uncharacterized protein n=1 Tax=Acer saccharum TaxID=4024 RepID=A0AA39RT73_ACESA|nr:hypothetical protein LWI29_003650 [Acer saccharum]